MSTHRTEHPGPGFTGAGGLHPGIRALYVAVLTDAALCLAGTVTVPGDNEVQKMRRRAVLQREAVGWLHDDLQDAPLMARGITFPHICMWLDLDLEEAREQADGLAHNNWLPMPARSKRGRRYG